MRLTKFPCKLLHLYVLLSFLIYGLVQIAKYENLTNDRFILYYLNDLLIMPIVFTAALNMVWVVKKNTALRLDIFSILSVLVFYVVYFEYYLPNHSSRYISDLYDILCYFIGTADFSVLQRMP